VSDTDSARKVAELTDDLVRLQAEFENYRKRIDRESAQRTNVGMVKVVAELLPLLDAFDKALDDAKRNGDAVSLRKGMETLHRQLVHILKGLGLREVGTDGMLDPFEHEAMMRQETDAAEDGKVLEVFQKGYALGPKVIRTAKVKVAKAPEPQITDHDSQESVEQEEETEED
jgi:molecular chaperone GrpE